MEMEAKVNKCSLIKPKNYFTVKETISKVEIKNLRMGDNNSKLNDWQKINFQNIQATCTIPYQKETNNPIKKRGKDQNSHFTKENIQVTNKHRKRCSTLLIFYWEMQIKPTRYRHTPVRMAIIKMSINIKAGEGVEKRERSCTFGGSVNWYSHNGRQYVDSLKSRNKGTIWHSNPTPRYLPWRNQV